jgi:dTDP-4-dehydrorhamnose 3,5-epimerase-like enzyme
VGDDVTRTEPADGQLEIVTLDGSGHDERGLSFVVPERLLGWVPEVRNMHMASVLPGFTRGNHYHATRRELIVIAYSDAWSLHWDAGPDTPVSNRTFRGVGAVGVGIPRGCAHAIRNDGHAPLWLAATSDGRYDPAAPDACRRIVAPPR